jgi:dipeptidase
MVSVGAVRKLFRSNADDQSDPSEVADVRGKLEEDDRTLKEMTFHYDSSGGSVQETLSSAGSTEEAIHRIIKETEESLGAQNKSNSSSGFTSSSRPVRCSKPPSTHFCPKQALWCVGFFDTFMCRIIHDVNTTAREAIAVMNDLMDTCGCASSGESFSIADRIGEVWLMEVIGRGDTHGKKGAVWVACRIPDGFVSAHANQARIATFPRDDPDHCLHAPDVIDVAVHHGLHPADKDPKDFSFSDIYDPVAFAHARFS